VPEMRDSRNTRMIFFLSIVHSRSSSEGPWCRIGSMY